jgi:hypothetical protein
LLEKGVNTRGYRYAVTEKGEVPANLAEIPRAEEMRLKIDWVVLLEVEDESSFGRPGRKKSIYFTMLPSFPRLAK